LAVPKRKSSNVCAPAFAQAALLFALLRGRPRAQASKRGGLAAQLEDVLRYTSFLGAFAGVFVAVDEALATCFGNKKWASVLFVIGRVAGLSMLLCTVKRCVTYRVQDSCMSRAPQPPSESHVCDLRTSKWRAALAGAAAGPTILLTGCVRHHPAWKHELTVICG